MTDLNSEQPDKEPPHSIELEQAYLGACLLNARVIDIVETLNGEHFYMPIHGRIFSAMQKSWHGGAAPTGDLLAPLFDGDEGLKLVGGGQYINRLASAAVTISGAKDYAAQIIDLWRVRTMGEVAGDILDAVDDFNHETDVDEMMTDALVALEGISDQASATTGRELTVDVEGELTSAIQQAEVAFKSGGSITGIKSGIPDLDEALSGFNSGLHIVAGRPGMGKTMLAVWAQLVASRQAATLYISLEMSKEEVRRRQLAALSGVSYTAIQRGNLFNDDFSKMMEAKAQIAETKCFIDDAAGQTVMDIRRRVRKLHREHKLGMVVVDHIGWVRPIDRKAMKVHQIETITQEMKIMSKQLDIPVIALAQLSRAVENRDDKHPVLSDLRDSGSIEQDADTVIFLYRYAYYLRQKKPTLGGDEDGYNAEMDIWRAGVAQYDPIMELLIRKNRHGPSPHDINVRVDMPTNRFINPERDAEPGAPSGVDGPDQGQFL